MTDDRLPPAALPATAGDGGFLSAVAEAVLQMQMQANAGGLISAGRHERTGERLDWRHVFRDRTLAPASAPRQSRSRRGPGGSHFLPVLEPRKTTSGRQSR
jgi:hypothetical protein